MLYWAFFFLILSLVAGVLGFTGVAGGVEWIGQLLFVISMIAFVFLFFKSMASS